MSFDKYGPKIDLKSLIESETPPIINSEFLDRFRALVCTTSPLTVNGQPLCYAGIMDEAIKKICFFQEKSPDTYKYKVHYYQVDRILLYLYNE